jgi:hypothetical protein
MQWNFKVSYLSSIIKTVLMSAWDYLVSDPRFIQGFTSCRAPYNATPTGLERSLVLF